MELKEVATPYTSHFNSGETDFSTQPPKQKLIDEPFHPMEVKAISLVLTNGQTFNIPVDLTQSEIHPSLISLLMLTGTKFDSEQLYRQGKKLIESEDSGKAQVELGKEWLELAGKQRHAKASFTMGWLYLTGGETDMQEQATKQSNKLAFERFDAALNQGYETAPLEVCKLVLERHKKECGGSLTYANTIVQGWIDSKTINEENFPEKNAWMLVEIGKLWREDGNYILAWKYFNKAAVLNSSEAVSLVNPDWLYSEGCNKISQEPTNKNTFQAGVDMLKLASKAGHAGASKLLGCWYFKGGKDEIQQEVIKSSEADALRYFSLALNQGYAAAPLEFCTLLIGKYKLDSYYWRINDQHLKWIHKKTVEKKDYPKENAGILFGIYELLEQVKQFGSARPYLVRAAELENTEAKAKIEQLYQQVSQDLELQKKKQGTLYYGERKCNALREFENFADFYKHGKANHDLGVLYSKGWKAEYRLILDLAVDEKLAEDYFRKAKKYGYCVSGELDQEESKSFDLSSFFRKSNTKPSTIETHEEI